MGWKITFKERQVLRGIGEMLQVLGALCVIVLILFFFGFFAAQAYLFLRNS